MARLSVCIEMIFRDLPFVERIRALAKAGFPAFEFWSWSGKDLQAIAEAKKRESLQVAAFGVNTGAPLVDPASRPTFVEGTRRAIEVAHALECKTLIVTVGNEMAAEPRERQHAAIVEALRAAAPVAEQGGVTLVVEPLNVLVNHKGYYLASSAEGFGIVAEVGSPGVRLLYDIYHQQITEGNLIQNITRNIDLIGHFHSADVPGRHEFGTGEINYRNVIAAIDEAGYRGYVGLEFGPSTTPEASLAQVKQVLSQ